MRAGEHVTPTLRLVRPLGYGAMGTVWVADHLRLDTLVALKLMAPAYAKDPEFVARFRQEAHAAERIKSPHVARVFGHGVTAGGVPYIVMELLDGETLGSRMLRLGPLPLGDVVRIVAHTGHALDHAHLLGIVHRDIKPDNLFLTEVDGELFVKVLDFGIAKQPPSGDPGITATGRFMGTPFYMSPEQLVSAKHVDHRTDLWAMAVVAYQALTGQLPFQGESTGAWGFRRPSALRRGLPAAVDAWAARALQPDPAARFASAGELAGALIQALRGAAPAGAGAAPLPGSPRSGPRPLATRAEPHREDGTLVSAGSPWEGRGETNAAPELRVGARVVRLVLGNIVEVGTEAIVNATDQDLSGIGVLDSAIHAAAGPELRDMLRRRGRCLPGRAVITGAGRIPHPTRFILHAVGPVYRPDREGECAALLRSVHVESLALAEKSGIRSLAFPAISTGTHGYPMDKAAKIALAAAVDHLTHRARSIERIVFVLFRQEGLTAFARALAALARA